MLLLLARRALREWRLHMKVPIYKVIHQIQKLLCCFHYIHYFLHYLLKFLIRVWERSYIQSALFLISEINSRRKFRPWIFKSIVLSFTILITLSLLQCHAPSFMGPPCEWVIHEIYKKTFWSSIVIFKAAN